MRRLLFVLLALALPVMAAAQAQVITSVPDLLTAGNVDHAANEVLLTAANVDHAANEVLLTSMDADTAALVVDVAAIEVDLAAIEVTQDALVVDLAAIEVLQTPGSDFTCVSLDITSAGTAEQGATLACKYVLVTCRGDNTGNCHIGGATGAGTTRDLELVKGTSAVRIDVANTDDLWFDAATTADTVIYCCVVP